MPGYQATRTIPPLVEQAQQLATTTGFPHSCEDGVGRLLHVLAGGVRSGRIGEIGAGCGVGAAWMMSAIGKGVSFISVELDEARAGAVRELLAPYACARILQGDWHQLLAHGPFDLLFADGGNSKVGEPERLVEALAPSGTIVLDDLTPEDQWPPEWQGLPDPVRQFWLNDPRLAATEILVTPASAVILATRIQERTVADV